MSGLNVAIIGASGGIGSALLRQLAAERKNTIFAFSRHAEQTAPGNVVAVELDLQEEPSIERAANIAAAEKPLDLVIVATGLLHNEEMRPERSLRELSAEKFEHNFRVNAIGPALLAKHFLPRLPRNRRSVFAALSARVSSISDNRLGGWYSYRASKAALNMIVKTASIETTRRQKQAIVVGLHPGTVDTALSAPFQKNVPEQQLFDADYSAQRLLDVIERLNSEDSGKLFAWDGVEIPA